MGIASLNEHFCVSGNLYFTTSFFLFSILHIGEKISSLLLTLTWLCISFSTSMFTFKLTPLEGAVWLH